MKTRMVFCSLFFLILSGCAAQKSVTLVPGFWHEQGKRVGVALFVLPHAETTEGVLPTVIPGDVNVFIQQQPIGDMAYEPLRLADLNLLQQAARKEDAEVFYRVQDLFVEGFRERGFDAFRIEQPVVKKEISKSGHGAGGDPQNSRDFRNPAIARNADYLMVIELVSYGPYCHYVHAYNDHMSVDADVRAELIDARTDQVLWREVKTYRRQVDASCSNRDHFPIIARELKSLLADTASRVPESFFSSDPLKRPPRRVIRDIKALSRAGS